MGRALQPAALVTIVADPRQFAPCATYLAVIGARIAQAIPMRAVRGCFGPLLAATGPHMGLDLQTARSRRKPMVAEGT